MSRSSAPVLTTLPLLLLLLLLGAAVLADDAHTTDISCSVQSCAALDVAVLSSYVSGLNVSVPQWPTNDTTSNESVQQLPPFGALASDWSRLLLLQNRQPEGSPLRDNLLRLSRILLAAYFDVEDDGGAEWSSRPSDDGQVEAQQASGNNATAAGQKKNDISGDNEETTPTTTMANNNGEPKNLNRTLPTMDNEANGRSGNESTTLTRDNEDESGRPETSATPGTTADDRFALTTATVASEGKSSESSVANEAVHPRSKEDFLEAKYAEKEGDGDDRVARFFMSDESDSGVTSDELVNNFFAMEDNVAKANQSSVEETTDHMTKSLEDFFNGEDNNNSTSVDSASFEFNSTKSIEDFFAEAEEVTKIVTTTDTEIDFNSQDSEEIISPSVEDFFAHEEDFASATTLEGNSTSGEAEVTKSVEDFFKSKETVDDQNKVATNKSISDGNVTNTEAMVPANLDVFSASKEENETMIEKKDGVIDKLASDESKKVSEDEKSNDTITSTTTFHEVTTTATTAVENATTCETIPVSTTTESYLLNNVTSTSADTPTTLVLNSLRIDDNLTTLAQLISGQLTTLLPASNSNEITSQVNEVVELSAKNHTTEDKNKLEVTTSTSPPSENRTTVKTDDLSTTTERETPADILVTQASSEIPVEEASAVTAPLVRQARHIPTSSHIGDSSPVIAPAIASPNSQPSSHKPSKHKESTLTQSSTPASPETRRRRRHRSVRSTHKRSDAVLDDDDQQYRTFSESRQTQFAEKRSRRGTQYEQQQRQH